MKDYTRAKKDKEAEEVEREKIDFLTGERGKDPALGPESAKALAQKLEGTEWTWEPRSTLKFGPNGTVVQSEWTRAGLVTRWEAVDRRTVVLQIASGRKTDRLAVLIFGDGLNTLTPIGFEGEKGEQKKRK